MCSNFCVSPLHRFFLKMMKLDNRMVLILALLLGAVGSVIASDWQAIARETACDHATPYMNDTSPVVAANNYYQFSGSGVSENQSLLEINCVEASNAHHECYWNKRSIVTGKFCSECLPICRSVTNSLNFVQFCIGISILALLAPLTITVLVIVASDITTAKSQVCPQM